MNQNITQTSTAQPRSQTRTITSNSKLAVIGLGLIAGIAYQFVEFSNAPINESRYGVEIRYNPQTLEFKDKNLLNKLNRKLKIANRFGIPVTTQEAEPKPTPLTLEEQKQIIANTQKLHADIALAPLTEEEKELQAQGTPTLTYPTLNGLELKNADKASHYGYLIYVGSEAACDFWAQEIKGAAYRKNGGSYMLRVDLWRLREAKVFDPSKAVTSYLASKAA